MIGVVCKGNAEAFEFCAAFAEWCHWIDDCIDKDHLCLPETAIRVNLRAFLAFSSNAFFQRHKECLTPLIVQAFRSYADSNGWEKRMDVRDRRAADVLKGYYHEVLWHTAYLAGGWEHLAFITKKYRSYDYDCKE